MTLRRKSLIFLVTITCIAGFVHAQEERMEDAPAIQFNPLGHTVILPKLQVHLVVIIHDEPRSPGVPEMYVSIYFADCSKHYSKVQILSLLIQVPDGNTKVGFKPNYLKGNGQWGNGEFLNPFGGEIMEEMLSDAGKKMMQTNVVYVIADPEAGSSQKIVVDTLRHASSIKLQLEFNLERQGASPERVNHDFNLKPEKVSLSIVRYGNGDSPINKSVIVPENAPGCLN